MGTQQVGGTLVAETSQIMLGESQGTEKPEEKPPMDGMPSQDYANTFGLASLEEIDKEHDEVDRNIELLTKK